MVHTDNNQRGELLGARTFEWFAAAAGKHRLLVNVVLVHNVLFALALLLAYLIRYDANWPSGTGAGPWFFSSYLPALPFFLLAKTLIFQWLKLFRGWWQYVGLRDIANIFIASWWFLVVAFVIVLVFVYVPMWLSKLPLFNYSKGVLVLDFMATVFLVSMARLGVRLYHEETRPASQEGVRRVLVVGAGNSAEALLREINRMSVERYRVIGLVDDDESKTDSFVHGVRVMGTTEDLKRICQEEKIDEVLIAVPSASQQQLRRIIEKCHGVKLHFQSLPSVGTLIDGRVSVSQIHQVEINDLLAREAVHLDEAAVGGFLRGRRILITGAGGSIGSEMCRQVCAWKPAQLILLEQAENSLFEIYNELRSAFPDIDVATVLCDIYDRARVMDVFSSLRPEVVIHAAAHKHVPMMELNPCEAIKNNILGTRNVADACCGNGVSEFVLISTDKAVNPSSIMGCSKRVAEIYVQSLNGRPDCPTKFLAVRFGNVLGSAGSVVPIFERQIRQGGPVTVTDPEMTRYFMTIPEASQLVLQAAATGTGGQILLLDMGEPVKIVDLARDMITLSGLRVGEDIPIAFTGARPGEKLFEELRIEGEDIAPTPHPKVKAWRHQSVEWAKIQQAMAQFVELANCPDRGRIVAALQFLVPEYAPLNLSEETARRVQAAAAEAAARAQLESQRAAALRASAPAPQRPVWRLLLSVPLCLCAEIACVMAARSGGVFVLGESTRHLGEVALFSAISAFLAGFVARYLGHNLEIMDLPGERSSHSNPTPRSGSIAIVSTLLLTGLFLSIPATTALWLGGLCLVLAELGLLDDMLSLRASVRFLVHTVVAVCAVAFLSLHVGTATDPSSWTFWASGAFCTLFIMAFINFFNFMDGINGLAGFQGIIGGGAIAAYLLLSPGQGGMAAMAIALAGVCLGFLPHNFPRAKMFMGDGGSTALGFLLAVLALKGGEGSPLRLLAFVMPLSLSFYDPIFTLVKRWRRGENLVQPHREFHFQLLVRSGWSHARTTLLEASLMLLCACVGGVILLGGLLPGLAALAVLVAVAPIYSVLVHRRHAATMAAADANAPTSGGK